MNSVITFFGEKIIDNPEISRKQIDECICGCVDLKMRGITCGDCGRHHYYTNSVDDAFIIYKWNRDIKRCKNAGK